MQEERPSKRTKTDGPAMRACVHCGQEKKIAQFSRDPSGPDGRQTWCMACMKVRLEALCLSWHGAQRVPMHAQVPCTGGCTVPFPCTHARLTV